MMQVHFEGGAKEVLAEMQHFLGTHGQQIDVTVPKQVKETKKAVHDVLAETKPAEASKGAPTLLELKEIITKMLDHAKIGKAGVLKLLAEQFGGAKKASDLKEDQYADFKAKAEELLKS